MRILITTLLIVCFPFCLFSGSNDNSIFIRSGVIDDDYIEEPLAESVIKYKNVLALSNQIIDLLISEKFDKIHDEYFSDYLKKEFPQEKYIILCRGVLDKVGKITEYKHDQWMFEFNKTNDLDIVSSIKIVYHGKYKAYYKFSFKLKDPQKLYGYHLQIKPVDNISNKI